MGRSTPADVVGHFSRRFSLCFELISTRAFQISWCACKDDQTSADTTEAGEAVGAMSYVRDTSSPLCVVD
jgi:hypothetical protein